MLVDALWVWLVTTISILIISRIPIGVEVDSLGKAVWSAALIGILNAILRPILIVLGIPFIIITFGLFLLVINAIIFGLAAKLIEGFRLRHGIWSALLGSFLLSLINSFLFQFLGS